jgi:hypothetical protein
MEGRNQRRALSADCEVGLPKLIDYGDACLVSDILSVIKLNAQWWSMIDRLAVVPNGNNIVFGYLFPGV